MKHQPALGVAKRWIKLAGAWSAYDGPERRQGEIERAMRGLPPAVELPEPFRDACSAVAIAAEQHGIDSAPITAFQGRPDWGPKLEAAATTVQRLASRAAPPPVQDDPATLPASAQPEHPPATFTKSQIVKRTGVGKRTIGGAISRAAKAGHIAGERRQGRQYQGPELAAIAAAHASMTNQRREHWPDERHGWNGLLSDAGQSPLP